MLSERGVETEKPRIQFNGIIRLLASYPRLLRLVVQHQNRLHPYSLTQIEPIVIRLGYSDKNVKI